MSSWKGNIIEIEYVLRPCGHMSPFNHYEHDPYREQRRQKMMNRGRCKSCIEKANAENNARQTAGKPRKVKKGQEMKMLPAGTQLAMVKQVDGWIGRINNLAMPVPGSTLEAEAPGAMGLMNKLARKYLRAVGVNITGKVT